MFSVSHLYFISHRWVHFFCTHLSVTFLYMCLLQSLCFFIVTETDFLFLCVADCFGVFLTMWSVESQILTSGLADDLLLFVHDFISFFFISSDKYICWQEVTIKPSWNFTFLNSFFTDVCNNEFPQIHAQIYPTPENSTFWIHIVKLPKIGRPNPQQTYYPPPPSKIFWIPGFMVPTFSLFNSIHVPKKFSYTEHVTSHERFKTSFESGFFYWKLVGKCFFTNQ